MSETGRAGCEGRTLADGAASPLGEREAKMTRITLRNSFHGTSARILFYRKRKGYNLMDGREYVEGDEDIFSEMNYLSQNGSSPEERNSYSRKIRRASRKLCGMSDCTCGTVRS